jgi:hypothetical protein
MKKKRFSLIIISLTIAIALVIAALYVFFPPKRGKEGTQTPGPSAVPSATTAPTVTAAPPAYSPSPSPSQCPNTGFTPSPNPYPGVEITTVAEGFFYLPLTEELKARITGLSYPSPGEECLIDYEQLCYIRPRYVDFEGVEHENGELIVNAALAEEVTRIFYELYLAKYPFTSVLLVDEFGEKADDNASMAANNTSAFNYRLVAGTSSLSRHSYGAAIDCNPLYNPYLHDGSISPPEGAPYADREKDFPGKIDHADLAYQLFTQAGWLWGGDWKSPDYQHFYKVLD